MAKVSSTLIVVRITYFTVVVYVYVIVLYLFYIKQLFTNLFLLHFQIKDGDMHAYVQSWWPHDGDRNQQNNQLLNPFLCNIFSLWKNLCNKCVCLDMHCFYSFDN